MLHSLLTIWHLLVPFHTRFPMELGVRERGENEVVKEKWGENEVGF